MSQDDASKNEQPAEIEETKLEQVAGGLRKSGGGDDLDDLQVERLRER